ncbi:MAG: hypothetical protein OK452_06275 [Thaumarchaeota archaeon]|nr:hypothetical protein [Nitrososphaerota archaeon]
MSPSDILVLVITAVLLVSAIIIVYLAIRLRGALVDRPYRGRALWTAIGAMSVVAFISAGYIDTIYGQVPTTVEGVLVEAAAWGFVFLALIGWIASNIDVALSADFFNRDPLRWKKGGKMVTIIVILTAYVSASLPSWWFPWISNSPFSQTLFETVFTLVIVYSTLVLAVTYFRIQDRRMKSYTKWVVLSITFLFFIIAAPGDLIVLPAVAWIYSMYRSVGSLAIRTRTLPT